MLNINNFFKSVAILYIACSSFSSATENVPTADVKAMDNITDFELPLLSNNPLKDIDKSESNDVNSLSISQYEALNIKDLMPPAPQLMGDKLISEDEMNNILTGAGVQTIVGITAAVGVAAVGATIAAEELNSETAFSLKDCFLYCFFDIEKEEDCSVSKCCNNFLEYSDRIESCFGFDSIGWIIDLFKCNSSSCDACNDCSLLECDCGGDCGGGGCDCDCRC